MQRTVEAVWRIESARLIAALARVTGDVGLAEDLAQDALVAALEQWPDSGVPDNPGAWLTAVARRRYVDTVRRAVTFERKAAELDVQGRLDAKTENPMDELEFDPHVTDDVLKLIFTACHPVLSRDGRVALTLKLVGGLSTEQVARAFLVPTPTMAARITRAKKALADAKVGFEVPVGPELANRFASVLEVVYLIFNEGYAATSGESWYRAELCDEAMRLGRMLSALAPDEPEAHALVALMEIQASRIPARTGPGGEPVTLLEQDRARWNRLLITHGLAALAKAKAKARPTPRRPRPRPRDDASARTSSRPSSPPATPARAPPPTPTGRASSRSTKPSASSPRPRSSSSTAPSPSPWPTARRRPSPSSTPSPTTPRCAAITCCPPSGPTCSPASAEPTRRARNSSAPPPSPPTTASAPTCSAAPAAAAAAAAAAAQPNSARYRFQLYGVVVDTFTSPDRSRIGRENSVESLLMYFLPIRSADRARSAVSAR